MQLKYTNSLFTILKHRSFMSSNLLPIVFSQLFLNETSLIIHKKNLLLCLTIFKLHLNFQYKILTCITGIEFLGFSSFFYIL